MNAPSLSITPVAHPGKVRVHTATCEYYPVVFEVPEDRLEWHDGVLDIEISREEYDHWQRVKAEYVVLQTMLRERRAAAAFSAGCRGRTE